MPDNAAIIRAMEEYREIGEEAFIRAHAQGHPAQVYFVIHEGRVYPMKAIWAAATNRKTPDFSYREALAGLPKLGYVVVRREAINEMDLLGDDDEDMDDEFDIWNEHQYLDFVAEEGARLSSEATRLKRSAGLVSRAKRMKDYICEGCGFDFREKYGVEYIEAHHINPIGQRDGIDAPTSINDLIMLCANCHRVVHMSKECLTLDELKRKIKKPKM
jgi:5-methylcytosine-specific restriction endonuclease McrA